MSEKNDSVTSIWDKGQGRKPTPDRARALELRKSENTGKKQERPKLPSQRKGQELATLATRVQSGEQEEAACKVFYSEKQLLSSLTV